MKKQLTLALFIAALLGILSIGCNSSCEDVRLVGSVCVFGKYNAQWVVLDNDTVNHRLLLLAMDVLEKPAAYHSNDEAITWEQSTIRSWLNGYGRSDNNLGRDYTSRNFMKIAFTDEEKAKIPKVTVVNDDNSLAGTPSGNNTQDYVFLLSYNEVFTFLRKSEEDHICTKIRCTKAWWLRTTGHPKLAAYVDSYGNIDSIGQRVDIYGGDVYQDHKTIGVRPALWLNY